MRARPLAILYAQGLTASFAPIRTSALFASPTITLIIIKLTAKLFVQLIVRPAPIPQLAELVWLALFSVLTQRLVTLCVLLTIAQFVPTPRPAQHAEAVMS